MWLMLCLLSAAQNYAQKLVDADRASIFLLDRKARELYARIFDVGSGSGPVPTDAQLKEIRFESSTGLVAPKPTDHLCTVHSLGSANGRADDFLFTSVSSFGEGNI